MIKRYADSVLTIIFGLLQKYKAWQEVELAVLDARAEAGEISITDSAAARKIAEIPIDEEWIDTEEKKVGHDYNAFVAERRRYLPDNRLKRLFHGEMTSYDGEEPATSLIMKSALDHIIGKVDELERELRIQVRKHRFTPRLERTHGRGAEVQSLGRFFITHITPLGQLRQFIIQARNSFDLSKLSGAIGSGGGLTYEVQRAALQKLDLTMFDGATQIMPRIFHSQAASALADLASWLEKIALDLWLGSRDPYPLWEEPFKPTQKGSSAMPWKKNPITLEKVRGLAREARALASAIRENIVTPEGRDISQSSVERLAIPDLFHTVSHMLTCLTKVMNGLNVYVDNLTREIVEMRGTYAGSKAKEMLAEWLEGKLDAETVYRIVQLAGFNAFEPKRAAWFARTNGAPQSLDGTDDLLFSMDVVESPPVPHRHFRDIIRHGTLEVSPVLDISEETVASWNKTLKELFSDQTKWDEWGEIFNPSYWLKHEQDQFDRVLGK